MPALELTDVIHNYMAPLKEIFAFLQACMQSRPPRYVKALRCIYKYDLVNYIHGVIEELEIIRNLAHNDGRDRGHSRLNTTNRKLGIAKAWLDGVVRILVECEAHAAPWKPAIETEQQIDAEIRCLQKALVRARGDTIFKSEREYYKMKIREYIRRGIELFGGAASTWIPPTSASVMPQPQPQLYQPAAFMAGPVAATAPSRRDVANVPGRENKRRRSDSDDDGWAKPGDGPSRPEKKLKPNEARLPMKRPVFRHKKPIGWTNPAGAAATARHVQQEPPVRAPVQGVEDVTHQDNGTTGPWDVANDDSGNNGRNSIPPVRLFHDNDPVTANAMVQRICDVYAHVEAVCEENLRPDDEAVAELLLTVRDLEAAIEGLDMEPALRDAAALDKLLDEQGDIQTKILTCIGDVRRMEARAALEPGPETAQELLSEQEKGRALEARDEELRLRVAAAMDASQFSDTNLQEMLHVTRKLSHWLDGLKRFSRKATFGYQGVRIKHGVQEI